MRVFSFYVDNELFAVDVNLVEKIVRKIPITYIPAAPDAVSGIINLKGRVITIFNLHELLGHKENQNYTILKSANIANIVVFKSYSGSEEQLGLIMDRPGTLTIINDEEIRLPSLTTGAKESYCICGIAEIDNMLYRIIDIDSIINTYKNIGSITAENISNGGMYDN